MAADSQDYPGDSHKKKQQGKNQVDYWFHFRLFLYLKIPQRLRGLYRAF